MTGGLKFLMYLSFLPAFSREMSIPLTPQYSAASGLTDGCTSTACQATLNATSSLSQGREFAAMTRQLHGGRRSRRGSSRGSRRSHRRGSRRRASRSSQRGGAVDYPSQFSVTLPSGMHAAADVSSLDNAFSQLPSFVGKYGGVGGRRTRGRKTRGRRASRLQRGGGFGYSPGATNAQNYMILSPAEEPKAFLNPQWYTENQVVPSFQGPTNALAQQSYNNQFNYAARGGSRKGRKQRKGRKGSRKGRKGRKGSRKH